jgi:hypothetical protein
MAQTFTSFTPIEEAEPQSAPTFTSFTPIDEPQPIPAAPSTTGTTPQGMAGYVPRRKPAPAPVDTSAPPAYKNRDEAVNDAINLLEEGADREEIKAAFTKMGVPWEEIIARGQQRGSDYFKQTTGPVSKGAMPPTGEIKASEEPGWLQGTANLFKRVDANLGDTATGLLLQTGNMQPDQAGRVIAANAKRRSAAMPDSETRAQMEEIGKAKTYGDAAVALASNPRATMTMLIESVATSLPMMAPALITGGIPGAVLAGVSSGGMEYGAVITDVLQDKGINLLDPNAISKALSDPKVMAEIKDKGAKRGLIVGGFDALSMGLAGRFLKPAKDLIAAGKLTGTAAKKATVAAWGKELSMQMGSGAGGEFAAQKATGDNKPVDVLLEALAEGVSAPLDVKANLRESAQLEKQAAFIPSAEQIARSKGFLVPEGKAPSKEPALDDAALIAATAPVEGAEPPRPFDDEEKAETTKIIARLVESGQPIDSANRIAVKQVLEKRKKKIAELVTEPTEDEVQQRAKELIDQGMEPVEAMNLAPVQIMEERRADALAEAEGAVNVRPTITEPSGAGVPVAGQPSADTAPGGVGIAEPSGMVPAGQDVAGAAGREEGEPATVIAEEGDQVGTETPEAVQAETQGQEAAPVESVTKSDDVIAEEAEISDDVADAVGDITTLPTEEAPKGKRGPKGARQTPEQKAASDERRKQQRKDYKQNVKTVDATEAALNEALAPIDEETIGSDEALSAAQTDKRVGKIQAIKSLVLLARSLKGTKLGDRVNELLKNPAITPAELENVKKGIAAQVSKATTEVKVGRADTRFSKMTTGQQALRHVIKTGNAFQRFLAARLLPFVKNVKFQVIEEGAPLPPQITEGGVEADWNESRGMFLRTVANGERFVFVRGATGGPNQGVNNVTVLHEMLHAALNEKIAMADGAIRAGKDLKSDLVKSFDALQGTMDLTLKRVKEMLDAGTLPEFMGELVVSDIFGDPREFVAYAMSHPRFQKFLMETEGAIKQPLFTRFVNNVRQFFNMGPMHTSALSDVINITDKMLKSRLTADMRAEIAAERAGADTTEVSSQLKSEGENEFGDPIRSAAELKKDAKIAAEKVRVSRQGEEGEDIEAMQMARDPRLVLSILQALVASKWKNMSYDAIQKLVALPTATFLADWSGIDSLKDTDKQMQQMMGMSQSLQTGAQKIVASLKEELNPLFRSAKKFRTQFENFVYETTIAQVDPSDPKAAERSPELDAQWKALGEKGQRMYRMLKQYYEDMVDLYSDLLDQQINNIQGMSPEGKKNLINVLRKTFETGARIRPYFPLVRRGDFWLRVEEKVGKETKQAFYMFETIAERDQKASELAAERRTDLEDLYTSGKFDKGENVKTLRTASQNSSAMLTQIFDAIDKEDFGSAEAKEALKDAIYQVYLNTMPEQSFRSQFIHRKDRAGFSTDVLRNVATTATKTSIQLAKLKYAPLLRNSLSAARDATKMRSNLSPFVEEMQKRVDMALTGPSEGLGDVIAGVANKVSYFWYLSSAASALIQPASIYIAGLPVLGANHNNITAAAKELGKMIALMNQYSVIRENADGTTSLVAPSLANNTKLPEDERNAIREMMQRGVVQSTYSSEVYGYRSTPTREASTMLGKTKELGKEAADLLVGSLMHNTERLTREAVFLASYRLGVRRGLTPDAAINQAVSDVNEALANYDITNRPRFMQQGIGKVALQFKMFPLHTALLLATNFKKMMPFLNKEGKKAAAIKFFGIYLTAGSLAGLAGLPFPFLGVIAAAFRDLQDDEDWPEDLKNIDSETWFRTVFLPEKLGEVMIGGVPVSEILETGPLNALTGLAIAERIGLNDLTGRDVKESKTMNEATKLYMIEKAGPAVGVGLSIADAFDAYAVGDYQKMMEKATPAVIRNLLLANKMANDGLKDMKGQTVLDPNLVSTGQILAQAIGFRPALLARMSETNFKLTGEEQKIVYERDRLMMAAKIAIRKDTPEGDAAFEKLLDTKIADFNDKHPAFAIEDKQLDEALEKDLKTRAESFMGYPLTEKNAELVLPALEQMEKRVERERAAAEKRAK